jgi:hypothetical protein
MRFPPRAREFRGPLAYDRHRLEPVRQFARGLRADHPQRHQMGQERMLSDGPAFDAQFAVLVSDYSVDEITHPQEAQLGKDCWPW